MKKIIYSVMRDPERAKRDSEIMGGIAKDKLSPRSWAVRQLGQNVEQFVARIRWDLAELRKHIYNLDDQTPLSEDAVQLAKLFRDMTEPGSEERRLMNYLIRQKMAKPRQILPPISKIRELHSRKKTA